MSGTIQVGANDRVLLGGDSLFYQCNLADIVRISNARFGVGKGPAWLNAGQGGAQSGYGASSVAAWTAQSGQKTFGPATATKFITDLSVNDWDNPGTAISLATSQANLTAMITTASANLGGAQHILFVGSLHTDPTKYAGCAAFNAGMKSVCDSFGAAFLDVQALWLAREALGYRDPTLTPGLVTFDHVHPQYTFMVPETGLTGKQIYAQWLMTGIQFV